MRGGPWEGEKDPNFILQRLKLFMPPVQGCWDDSVSVSLVGSTGKPVSLLLPRLSRQMKAGPSRRAGVLQAEVASGQLWKASFAYMQMSAWLLSFPASSRQTQVLLEESQILHQN